MKYLTRKVTETYGVEVTIDEVLNKLAETHDGLVWFGTADEYFNFADCVVTRDGEKIRLTWE